MIQIYLILRMARSCVHRNSHLPDPIELIYDKGSFAVKIQPVKTIIHLSINRVTYMANSVRREQAICHFTIQG